MTESIGWTATLVFTASYFFRQPAILRRVQAVAACLWIAYGLANRSWPVVAANVLVVAAALLSAPLVALSGRFFATRKEGIARQEPT